MEKICIEIELAIENQRWAKVSGILNRDRESVQQLLTENCDLFHNAIIHNAPADVINLLVSPHNINMQNKDGNAALIEVMRKKRWELVPVLLQFGADVNLCDTMKQSPLHLAARHGAPADIVTQLISPHNINMEGKHGHTPLHLALGRKGCKLVPILLQRGADVNLCNRLKQTPLLLACRHHAPADIILQLISPCNINMQAKDGDTALQETVLEKRWDLVPVLLQHGADINLCDAMKQSPLFLASCHGAPADIITQLISPHTINMQARDGNTALHGAVKKKRWELVPFLLQYGADINLYDYLWNRTVLHEAAYHGATTNILTQLISADNINLQARAGYTAIHEAVREKRWELVPVLLQHGADPSMLDTPQPDQLLVLSLKALCIVAIRGHMPVKSDEAYQGLGLPGKLAAEVKLRPQAEDIIQRGCCE